MTPSDDNFAKKIATYLDQGAADLKPGTAYRLQLARAEALARLADPQRAAELRAGRRATRGAGRGPPAAVAASGRAAGSGSESH